MKSAMESKAESKSRLGRGLAALLGDTAEELGMVEAGKGATKVPISHIAPNKRNPRRSFQEDELEELAASIRQKGVIQPIIVRPNRQVADHYEIIAGERRWRAAQLARLDVIPVLVVEVSDAEALELAIIENVQRADLNPLEEAQGYDSLMQEFAYSQADMAGVIGKSRSHVANMLRLLKLPEFTRILLAEGKISAGHARALLAFDNPDELARQIVEKNLSVRDIEKMSRADKEQVSTATITNVSASGRKSSDPASGPAIDTALADLAEALDSEVLEAGDLETDDETASAHGLQKLTASAKGKDANTIALEKSLSEALGLTVDITHHPSGGGKMVLSYLSIDQLEMLCTRLIVSG